MVDKYLECIQELNITVRDLSNAHIKNSQAYRNISFACIGAMLVISILFFITVTYCVNKVYSYDNYPTTPSISNTNTNNNNNK